MIVFWKQRITVASEDVAALSETDSQATLLLSTMRDAVHIFVNGQLVGTNWSIGQITSMEYNWLLVIPFSYMPHPKVLFFKIH
jgi:hypothetical protein